MSADLISPFPLVHGNVFGGGCVIGTSSNSTPWQFGLAKFILFYFAPRCGLGHALDSGLASRERGIGDEEGEIDVETEGRGEKRNGGETIQVAM